MSTYEDNEQQGNDPKANLEQMLIEEFLADHGYALADLETMPADDAKHLLAQASKIVSLQLTEIETSAHLWSDVKG